MAFVKCNKDIDDRYRPLTDVSMCIGRGMCVY